MLLSLEEGVQVEESHSEHNKIIIKKKMKGDIQMSRNVE